MNNDANRCSIVYEHSNNSPVGEVLELGSKFGTFAELPGSRLVRSAVSSKMLTTRSIC